VTMDLAAARVLALLLLLSPGSTLADGLQERIDHIQEISVTAPWQTSEALIAALEPELEDATERQRNQIRFIQIRNLALAGNERAAIGLMIPLLEQVTDPDQKLRAYELIANLHFNLGEYTAAFEYLKSALNLVPEMGSVDYRVAILSMAANFFRAAGLTDKALEYGLWSADLARLSGNLRWLCITKTRLGEARFRLGHKTAALNDLNSAGEICDQSGDPVFTSALNSSRARILTSLGQLEEAEENARKGLELAEFAGYRNGVLYSRLEQVRVFAASGQWPIVYDQAGDLAEEFRHQERWEHLAETLELQSRAAEAMARPLEALAYIRQARMAETHYRERESKILLAYLQLEFDTLSKLQEIELLSERNLALEREERGREQLRRYQTGAIAGAIVIAGLLLLLLHRSRSDRLRFMRLSQRDSLTGLYNHSQFLRLAESDLEAARSGNRTFVLVIADIDHFKALNDRYGHLEGDSALQSVSRLLQEVFSPLGPVGRIGGEEFAVALNGVAPDKVRVLVRIFSQRLETLRGSAGKMHLTLSFGMAVAEPEETLEALRHKADNALYEAKRGGRNRLVEASGTEPES